MTRVQIISEDKEFIAKWTSALAEQFQTESSAGIPSKSGNRYVTAEIRVIDAELIDRDPTLLNHAKLGTTRIFISGKHWPEKNQIMALVAGASGYCDTDEPAALLTKALASVLKGDIWIKRHLIPKVIGSLVQLKQPNIVAPPPPQQANAQMLDSLSEREREVAQMVCHGVCNKKIGSALDISERTVKAHLTSIFKKLQVTDRLHLVVLLKEADRQA